MTYDLCIFPELVYAYTCLHTYTHSVHMHVCAWMYVAYHIPYFAFALECMFNRFFNWGQVFVIKMTFHLWVPMNVCCKSVQLLLYVTQITCKMTPWAKPPAIFFFTSQMGKNLASVHWRSQSLWLSLLPASASDMLGKTKQKIILVSCL